MLASARNGGLAISSAFMQFSFPRRPNGRVFFTKGDQFFCCCYDSHHAVQVRFAGVHLDGDRDHLNDLGGAFADIVAAQHSVRIRVDNQFHSERLLLPARMAFIGRNLVL